MDGSCQLSVGSQPKSVGLVWGLVATWHSVCIHQMNSRSGSELLRQLHKYRHGYYHYYCVGTANGCVLVSINKVTLRRARPVQERVTIFGRHTTSVSSPATRSTQPTILSGMQNEYRLNGSDALWLGSFHFDCCFKYMYYYVILPSDSICKIWL